MNGIFLHRTPSWIQFAFPNFTWRRSINEQLIYLTFDDGPIPGITPMVLDCLNEFQAKATFFCVGENIHRHPGIFRRIVQEGHRVGNHTYHHLDGWRNSRQVYLENVHLCQDLIDGVVERSPKPLMRPPYGRIKPRQWRTLQKDYEIVMWDVLSGDFHAKIAAKTCLKKICDYTSSGSIVVFHDSLKAKTNLRKILPSYLSHFSRLGYSFDRL